jgi:hypothetical protein
VIGLVEVMKPFTSRSFAGALIEAGLRASNPITC